MNFTFATPSPDAKLSMRTAAAIIAGNLIPVFGVLFLGWDAGQILLLYWFENVVIGVLAIPRILSASGPVSDPPSVLDGTHMGMKLFLAIFFCIHYGIFCLAHGFFSMMLATLIRSGGREIDNPSVVLNGLTSDNGFLLACAGIVVVQLFLFWREWIRTGLWRTSEPKDEMGRPYGRIFVLHIAIIFGAFALFALGAPAWVMLILCAGKTVLELAQARAGSKPVATAGV